MSNIGVYVYQLDNLRWRVDGECNGQTLSNNPDTNKPNSSLVCVNLHWMHQATNPLNILIVPVRGILEVN